jgi:hypothetical protein
LGIALEQLPPEWMLEAASLTSALKEPPADSRAAARSRLMHFLKDQSMRYYVDWEVIDAEGFNSLSLLNPFDAKPAEADAWLAQFPK